MTLTAKGITKLAGMTQQAVWWSKSEVKVK